LSSNGRQPLLCPINEIHIGRKKGWGGFDWRA